MNLDNETADHCILGKEEGTEFAFLLFFDDSNPIGTDRVDMFLTTQAANQRVTSDDVISTATWHACGGNWVRNTADGMGLFVDGIRFTGNAPGTTADNPNETNAANVEAGESAGGRDMAGDLAELAGWDAFLSDNEMTALAHGIPPFVIRFANLQIYASLHSGLTIFPNWSQNPTLVGTNISSTSVADHPPVELIENYL